MSEENIANKIETAPLGQSEAISTPDDSSQVEVAIEKKVEKMETKGEPTPQPSAPVAAPVRTKSLYEARLEQIEQILSEGLEDTYLQMSPQAQGQFKAKGEETTRKINQLMSQAKVKMKKIVELIRNWLKVIPGVNRFFLEQEAKIKADKIVKLKHQ
ncbi:MAG TPA: hypothetical protein PKI61_04310 [bacterium]|nr:hypothetical protein [bacterium]HPT29577.1 hypothetical protein [bacterium]